MKKVFRVMIFDLYLEAAVEDLPPTVIEASSWKELFSAMRDQGMIQYDNSYWSHKNGHCDCWFQESWEVA